MVRYDDTKVVGEIGSVVTQLTRLTSTVTLPTLTTSNIFVGNAGSVAADVAMSGDATISVTGSVTVSNSAYAGSAGNAATSDSATTSGSCSGNSATATYAGSAGNSATADSATTSGSCSGNSATATTAGSCSGNAATATKLFTARTIAGSSFDGTANVVLSNKFIVQGSSDAGLNGAQFLGSLATGLVKNTTGTGVLSIATAGTDYIAPTSQYDGHIYINALGYSGVTQGTWYYGTDDIYGALCLYNDSGTNEDRVDYTFSCSTGTYTFRAFVWTQDICGILQLLIDETSKDTYDCWVDVGYADMVLWTKTGISLTAGTHTLSIKVNGKNASSSGYLGQFAFVMLWRTS